MYMDGIVFSIVSEKKTFHNLIIFKFNILQFQALNFIHVAVLSDNKKL